MTTTVILFIFGLIVGSFLNVVVLRWGTGRGFSGRSKCPHCEKTLEWYELVPVVSFFLQRGKCRACAAKLSPQYPVIEVFTGVVFATIFNLELSILDNLLLLVVFSIYIVIAVYDFYHKIIPDELVYSAIVLSLFARWLSHGSALDWLAGPIIFLFFGSVWALSKGRAMGFGDAKLGLSIGLLLGGAQGLSAIVLSFWLGAIFGIAAILLKLSKDITMKSEVPFAPFILVGTWLSVLLQLDLLHVSLF